MGNNHFNWKIKTIYNKYKDKPTQKQMANCFANMMLGYDLTDAQKRQVKRLIENSEKGLIKNMEVYYL